ncbi:hypothetical protein BKA82DRAFT_4022232 [Pisolithus tinctorius]|nr:hypothetical protein BKA82DRAFT_4022232 [Pisolithus tinctorius]
MTDSIAVQLLTTDDIHTSKTPALDVSSSLDSCKSPPSPSSVVENLKENTLAIYVWLEHPVETWEVQGSIPCLVTFIATIYTAMPNLAAHAEFFFGSTSGDVTVLKCDTDDVTELVLSGIFEIDHQGFFMGPDGGYSPRKECIQLWICGDQANLVLEKLVPLKKGESLLSLVVLLSRKKEELDDSDNVTRLEDTTMAWPVQDELRDVLCRAASTHYISPLPVFDIDSMPIRAANYHHMLCGAIVQVHFALLHFFIKGDRKSIFTSSLHEMRMLHAPACGPINPFKCICQGSQHSFEDVTQKLVFRHPTYICKLALTLVT